MMEHQPPASLLVFRCGGDLTSQSERRVRAVPGTVPRENAPTVKLDQLEDLRWSSIAGENHLGASGGVWWLRAAGGG